MKKRIYRWITFALAILCLCTSFVTPTSALEWSGDANGAGGNATGVSDYGFAIADDADNLAGYRFSVVDAEGNTRNGKVIDMFRQTSMGRLAYYCTYATSGHKMNPKRNKVQWIQYQNSGYSTSQNTANSYLEEKTVFFTSAIPLTTSVENWVKVTTNLNTILLRLEIGSYHDLNPGDRLLVEPLYHIRINNNWHTLTVTEIGVFGKSKFGANSQGEGDSSPGYWTWIRKYTNRMYPNSLHEPTGANGLWTPASEIGGGGFATFQQMINWGYGVGIAYDTSVENGYTVQYMANGAESGSTPDSSHIIGVSKQLNPNGYQREYHIFKGWNSKPDGSGTAFTDKQTVKNLTTEENTVVKLYAQWELDPVIQIEAIEPNSQYREGVRVISSFRVINESEDEEFTPDRNVTVKFTVKKGGSQIYSANKTGVVLPLNETNLVYFKWTVPTGLENANVTVSAEVLLDDLHMDKASMSVPTRKVADYQTPDTQYERSKPDDWSAVSIPSETAESKSWSEWVYENGSFKKNNYRISTSSVLTITPDTGSPSGGGSSIKSGYGFTLKWEPEVTSTGSSAATTAMYTNAQTAYARFPEFKYTMTSSTCRLLEKTSDYFQFYTNDSAEGDRLHFTPLWYPNGSGNYTVSVQGYDIWTPMGMLTINENSNSMTVNGSLYDDYFIGRK